MNRIKIISSILAVAICFSLSACGKSDKTDDFTETVTSVSYAETETTEAPEELKKFTFNSAQEVEAISDEDLIYIASNSHFYNASDFLGESFATVDYFDVPLMVTTSDGYTDVEDITISILYADDIGADYSSDAPLSTDKIKAYADEMMKEFIRAQNTMEPGDDTGILVTDEEVIYCGDNASYVEYSARYVDNRSMYSNDELITYVIPRAYRWVFLKNFVRNRETNEVKLIGELSKEYVQEQLDIERNDSYIGVPVYREVTEDDKSFYYNYYLIRIVYGDWNVDSEAILSKCTITVDKETHIVSGGGWGTDIKSLSIPGTALKW